MGIISLIAVEGLMLRSALKQYKKGEFAWEVIVLIPVLIFIANAI